jgi:hypothetical protein
MKDLREKLTRAMRTRVNLYGYGLPDAADVLYEVPKLLDRLEAMERQLAAKSEGCKYAQE